MGRETENFSEEEVDEVLRYLLPTRLSARDARPLMKVGSLAIRSAFSGFVASILLKCLTRGKVGFLAW